MDLYFSEDDEKYRLIVRRWLSDNQEKMKSIARAEDPVQAAREWQRCVFEAGYVGLSWPKQYGGQEASLTRQVIVSEEMARAKAPSLINMMGLSIFAPTLIKHGNEAQKKRFLPGILSGDKIWCQGFSEPGAGSDLASLRSRAELEGDAFVVNGQKVWTTLGFLADWIFLLVRTDKKARKQEGITYLMCDMKTPGITVKPLRNAGGGTHFSEIFFDDVRIPKENLIGQINQGWKIARSSLDHERSGLSGVLAMEANLEKAWHLAATVSRGNKKALEKNSTRQTLAQHWIQIEGLRYLGYRALSDQLAGREPGPTASVGKLFASNLRQEMSKFALEIAGPLAAVTKKSPHVLDRGRWQAAYFDSLGYSIGGGTSEIMRNVIAERVLDLPRSVEG